VALLTRTTPSSVSEVVARLVRRGLVTRQPSARDRRRAELTVTAAGHAVLASAPETVQEQLLAGFERLGDASRRTLADTLEAWLAASGLDDVSPALFFERSKRTEPASLRQDAADR
jgi:DNA-binding MarR family transcriptional regulator